MDEIKGVDIIRILRQRWVLFTILSDCLVAAGAGWLLAVLMHQIFRWPYGWGLIGAFVVFLLFFYIHRIWLVREKEIAQLLDQRYPQLEESCGLLLQPPASLNTLEALQYRRTTQALNQIKSPLALTKKIIVPLGLFAILLIAGWVLLQLPFSSFTKQPSTQQLLPLAAARTEKILPQVADISVVTKPPAYTGRPAREQHAFNVLAEEGAAVHWQLQTSIRANSVQFIFNDKAVTRLQAADAAGTQWRLIKKIDTAGFYQVNIDGKLSALYKIETIADRSPVIRLLAPQQYTTIDYGEIPQVKIISAITDDYAVADAAITATIASGSGEAVKFKEQRISLPGFVAGKTQYHLQQLVSLTGLGMQPGDELYFYVQATDNHQQQTRSDIYIVHLPDTAQLMSLDGLANTLTLKPEYFRSQRQIIIETEQLLKDKDTISAQAFKDRSNNLGVDQKLLRLRYGKFLGDEAESGEGGAAGLGDIADFSNAEKIKDAFTDKHDNAEDATFYEPETKKQLRATLTEMWDAELRLRTFTPQEALPFEYKALRLLKDLQQKSRAYVAKANFKTTPLDLKKRLTGDLNTINSPVVQKDSKQEADALQATRLALAQLQQISTAGINQHFSTEILQQANLLLHQKAIQQPAVYLQAVEAMKRILDTAPAQSTISVTDLLLAEEGLQQLLTVPDRLPSAAKSNTGNALSRQYFKNLQKTQP